MTRPVWRFDGEPDAVVWCRGARYDLHHTPDGKFVYLFHPLPELRALILEDGQHLFLSSDETPTPM
jgi:hypothetical protein